MEVKLVDIIDVLTESCSSVNYVLDNSMSDNEPNDNGNFALSGDEYLGTAYAMDTSRQLWRLIPEDMLKDDVKEVLRDYYLHQMSEDGTEFYDIRKLRSMASALHSAAYALWNEAKDALRLAEKYS